MIESSISKKGQTTLPRPVRNELGIKAGDRIRYFICDGEVRIIPVRPISRLFGIMQYDGPPVSVEQMERDIADEAAGK